MAHKPLLIAIYYFDANFLELLWQRPKGAQVLSVTSSRARLAGGRLGVAKPVASDVGPFPVGGVWLLGHE